MEVEEPPPGYDERMRDGGREGRRSKDRSRERDRDRSRDRRDRSRSRDRSRRDEDRDRRSSRRRSRSRDRGERRSSRRSRSRSGGRRRRRRPTQWDVLPPGGIPPPGTAAALPVAVPPIPGLTAPVVGAPPQATRFARRLYIGGLPPGSTDQAITSFFMHALTAIGGTTAPGCAILNVYHNNEKNFAFVEFRTIEETSNSLALDGVLFDGLPLRVRRPNDYNAAQAVGLGPANPDPNLNLAAIGLGAPPTAPGGGGGGGHHDDPNRVFVGGIPHYLGEEQVRELLQSFGAIKILDLIKDKETGQSRGYAFVIYEDPAVTDLAIAGLNGLALGERSLTVRRANTPGAPGTHATAAGGLPPPPGGLGATGANLAPLGAINAMDLAAAAAGGTVGATRIVVLVNCVQREELADDEEYAEIFSDMQEECSKYGQVRQLIIPRPADPEPPGVGKVIIEFDSVPSAVQARTAMHGRKFGGHQVIGTFLPEAEYEAGAY